MARIEEILLGLLGVFAAFFGLVLYCCVRLGADADRRMKKYFSGK